MARPYNAVDDEKKKGAGYLGQASEPVSRQAMVDPGQLVQVPNTDTDTDEKPKPPVYGAPEEPSAPAANYDQTRPDSVFGNTTDPELLSQYQAAMQALQEAMGKTPQYGSQYDAQIQSLYEQIIGRKPFKYDQNTDPLYQQYKQDYIRDGQMAMRDTMGQAAGLTGGYGSSYAQAVGQQQYDQYLQKLGDVLPETYGMALDAYKTEGDQLNQQLATTTALEQADYQKYLDALKQHNTDVGFLAQQAETAYGHMTDAEQQAYKQQMDQYELQHDYYNQLLQLMQAGYQPSKDDFNAAGISEAQGMALWDSLHPVAPEPQYVYITKPDAGNNSASTTGQTETGTTQPTKQDAQAYLQYLQSQGYEPGSQLYQAIAQHYGLK